MLRMSAVAVLSLGAPCVAAAPVFIENQGQWEGDARFVLPGGPLVAGFEPHAIALHLRQVEPGQLRGVVVRMVFDNARDDVTLEGRDRRPGRYNYLVGDDRARWRTEVPGWSKVVYRGLYDGIGMRVREGGGHFEYDLLLEPGADLDAVHIRAEGVDGLEIASDGALVMQTVLGPIRQSPPTTWQTTPSGEHVPVESRFCLVDEVTFGFDVASPDPALPMVIDPALEWCTYFGGSGDELVLALDLDESGNPIVAGTTGSVDLPTTPGAYDRTFTGAPFRQAYVARFDPGQAGQQQLVWCTFLGGAGTDEAYDVVLDDKNRPIVVGLTNSSDFPVAGAFDETHNGGLDAFVARLSADGSALEWSTYLGGASADWANAVDIDPQGRVSVGGYAFGGFPTTPGAYDTTFNGGLRDAFVSRLDPTQVGHPQLVWSTFLGGPFQEGFAYNTASVETGKLDLVGHDDGQVTVGGFTTSADFPVTPDAYDTVHSGNNNADCFITRLSADGTSLVWSTFLGGATFDETVRFMHVDGDGVVTVTGHTRSPDFPTTDGAFDTTHNSPDGDWNDGFVTRLDPSLTGPDELLYSTFLGGTANDASFDLAVDESGVITVATGTFSVDFPVSAGAYNETPNGEAEGAVTRLSPDGMGALDLLYSTFIGGGSYDDVYALDVDGPNDVVMSGHTSSLDLPVTATAFDTAHNGGVQFALDIFAARLDLCPSDLDDNGVVDTVDFLALLAAWGPNPGHPADLNEDGVVDTIDFLKLLADWGACP